MGKGAINAFIMWFLIMLVISFFVLLSAYRIYQSAQGG
jgi:CHASE3 domain sensor protein